VKKNYLIPLYKECINTDARLDISVKNNDKRPKVVTSPLGRTVGDNKRVVIHSRTFLSARTYETGSLSLVRATRRTRRRGPERSNRPRHERFDAITNAETVASAISQRNDVRKHGPRVLVVNARRPSPAVVDARRHRRRRIIIRYEPDTLVSTRINKQPPSQPPVSVRRSFFVVRSRGSHDPFTHKSRATTSARVLPPTATAYRRPRPRHAQRAPRNLRPPVFLARPSTVN